MSRPATVKLTPAEYQKLEKVLEADLGADKIYTLLGKVFSVADIARMAKGEKPELKLTKSVTAAFIRELADLHAGDRAADVAWAVTVAERVFDSEERALEVITYARHRVAEYEASEGVTLTPPPVNLDAIDVNKITMIGKNKIDIRSSKVIPGTLSGVALSGSHVNYLGQKLPSKWWSDKSNPRKGPRLHVYWPDGQGGYRGGHYEWTRFPGQPTKEQKNIRTNYLGEKPPAGSPVFFCTISHDPSERTPIVKSSQNWGG